MMNSIIPVFVIVPLISALLIMIFGNLIKGFQRYFAAFSTLVLVVMSIYAFLNLAPDSLIYCIGGWESANQIPFAIYLVLDGLSVLMLTVISILGFLSCFYSISYMRNFTSENNFYALLCLMIAGMNGVVLSGDIFNQYVFLEISVIASYALVAFGVGKQELEASFKYQVLGGVASLFILMAITLIYWKTKTLNIADIRELLTTGSNPYYNLMVQALMLTGFGLKAAIMPFHAWLPDAHSSAPSPISAMLSGVLIKAVGIYVIIRIFFNMFPVSAQIGWLVTVLGAISMVAGVFLAYGQWDIKRLLAYHSISQMGYVVLSLGIGMLIISRHGRTEVAALAITGGLFHMVNHAIFKGLLFLNAGAIEYRTGTRNLREMGGLSAAMPATSATSFVASMAISGIPPFNGFFSKLIIIVAAIKGQFYFLALLAVIVSIITLASFLKFQRYAFFNKETRERTNIKEVPWPMVFSMVTLAVLCLALSALAFTFLREAVLSPAVDLLVNTGSYSFNLLGK
jgi:multicomponent Na+:H+ antiporter subunit D